MNTKKKPKPNPLPWPKFIKLWDTKKLSVEQTIGQLLVWGQLQHEQLIKYERRFEEQERYIADLSAQLAESKGGNAAK